MFANGCEWVVLGEPGALALAVEDTVAKEVYDCRGERASGARYRREVADEAAMLSWWLKRLFARVDVEGDGGRGGVGSSSGGGGTRGRWYCGGSGGTGGMGESGGGRGLGATDEERRQRVGLGWGLKRALELGVGVCELTCRYRMSSRSGTFLAAPVDMISARRATSHSS